MFARMDAPLKNVCTASLGITYTTCHILDRKQTTWLSYLLKTCTVTKSSLTVPDWLNVKFHYFLIGPKVKILNTLTPLAPIYVTLFPVS